MTVLVGLGALVVLLAVLTWQSWGDLGSRHRLRPGRRLARLADGELPYATSSTSTVRSRRPLGALFVLVGGSGLAPFIALGLVIAVAIVFTTYALARSSPGPLASGLAAAIIATVAFAPTNFSFVLAAHPLGDHSGCLAALLFLLGVSRFAADGTRGWLGAPAVPPAAVTLTRPEFALAVVDRGRRSGWPCA